MQNGATAPGAPDAAVSIFGVSPPVRSGCYGGAANPIAHDHSWKRCAYNASHSNLQALREIDSAGAGFLRSVQGGDPSLLLGSPEFSFCEGGELFPRGAGRGPSMGGGCPTPMAVCPAEPFSCKAQYFAVK